MWARITLRQKDALRTLVEQPTRERAAEQINVAITTLDSHKTEIFRACRLVWDTEIKLDVHFLRRKFGPFFAGMEAV